MKKTSQILVGILGLACTTAWTSPALAIDGLTANADITSNYIFRGITQSANRPAVSWLGRLKTGGCLGGVAVVDMRLLYEAGFQN